jgi:hypothetical protein
MALCCLMSLRGILLEITILLLFALTLYISTKGICFHQECISFLTILLPFNNSHLLLNSSHNHIIIYYSTFYLSFHSDMNSINDSHFSIVIIF